MTPTDGLYGADAREFFERQQAFRRRMQFGIGGQEEVFFAEGPDGVEELAEPTPEPEPPPEPEGRSEPEPPSEPEGRPEPEPSPEPVPELATPPTRPVPQAEPQPGPVPDLAPFHLRVLAGEPEGTFSLRHGENTLGRAASSDVRLQNRSVSHAHAVIAAVGGRITIRDTNSTNGTQVNGRYISEPTELTRGDRITLGDVLLEFEEVGGVDG